VARRTVSRQTYEMRRGDLVRFAGNRDRLTPPWSPESAHLRRQEDWVRVAAGEEMNLVGRLPYSSSYEWLLERRTPTEQGRWVVARGENLAVLQAAIDRSPGRTAILPRGDIILITRVHSERVRRQGWPTVSGVVNNSPSSGHIFHDLWVMLAGPDDYEDPELQTFISVNSSTH